MIPFRLLNKAIRAQVIAEHLRLLGATRCVVYTCGNAARALREEGLDVVEVGPRGALQPSRELTYEEILQAHPGLFNATSGHLPPPLMYRLAERIFEHLPVEIFQNHKTIYCPCGSGETLVAMAHLVPFSRLVAVVSDQIAALRFDFSPLKHL
ncbi:MAG: hypothetical protein P9M14_04995, partial [Candidatus Alcyoniella australis]|nr:hypothetical protein [Candidatus Alcyoniella australis]